MNVIVHKRPKPLTAADHTRIEEHMFKVEFIQSLIARHRAEIRKLIVKEQKKTMPDTLWIEEMEAESSRLFSLRSHVCNHPEEAGRTLASLKVYKMPKPVFVS